MFYKVLIATDSSPSSLAVIGHADFLHLLGARECVLAQCFLIREHVAFPDQIKASIESGLVKQKEMLEKEGIHTTIVVESGFPGTQIPRIATENNCSLIMIGSHGHHLTSEVLMGSIAAEIIHNATKPIFMIRLEADENADLSVSVGKGRDLMRHVLYATDFSKHAERAFNYLSKLVEHGVLCVTLIHVQDKAKLGRHFSDRLEEFNRIDLERLNLLKARLKDIGDAQIEIEIPYGSPTNEILQQASVGNVSIIIMGTHGRGFVSELFLGSVSHNVARHSKVPILLIPG